MMTALGGHEPLGVWLGMALAFSFPLTWLTWIVCLMVAGSSRRSQALTAALPLPNLRQTLLSPDDSHIWVMPIYVWGYEASICFRQELFTWSHGLVSVERSLEMFYVIFFALAVLVVVQTLAIMALRGDARTLGLDSLRHTAAVAVILTLFLQVSLYFMVSRF